MFNKKTVKTTMWFGKLAQNLCDFHLGFHWTSTFARDKLSHFYWLANLGIIKF